MRSGPNDRFKLRLLLLVFGLHQPWLSAARRDANFNAGDVSW